MIPASRCFSRYGSSILSSTASLLTLPAEAMLNIACGASMDTPDELMAHVPDLSFKHLLPSLHIIFPKPALAPQEWLP